MYYKTHIRLVNSHSKGYGSHNYVYVFFQETILVGCSRSRIHAGMVCTCINSICLKYLGQFFHFLTAQAINDAWFSRIGLNEFNDISINIRRLRAYLIIQIRAIEWRFKLLCILHSQILLDIHTHFGSSRSRQCNHRRLSYLINNRTDAAIFRTEIMPPLRNTVCFVYCIEWNLHSFQKIYVLILCQWLRGYVEQFCLTTQDIRFYLVDSRLI